MTEIFENHDRLVPYKKGLEVREAQVLKSLLEANGVPAFLTAENMAAFYPGIYTDILVRDIDRVRADGILANIEPLKLRPSEHVDDDEPACQQCGSMHIHAFSGSVPTFIPGIKFEVQAEDGWVHCLQCDSYYRTVKRRFSSINIALVWAATLGLVTLALIVFLNWLRLY